MYSESKVKLNSSAFFRQCICLDFALLAFVVYDASCDNNLFWASWHFYQYLTSAPFCQVNTVKNDILKLFDSIEKYGMCTFAFNLFKFKNKTVDVHL